MQSTTSTHLSRPKVLGKRKGIAEDTYVLHLASSPEPSGEQSDLDSFRNVTKSKPQVPVLVNGKLSLETKRLYSCTYDGCKKSYPKPSRLAEHERSHTGEVRDPNS